MRWIEVMRREPSDPGESSPFAMRAVSEENRRGHKRHRLCGAMVVFLAVAASVSIFAQAPPVAPRFVVVLDAAHGGDDAGARLGDEAEKAYTLVLSIKLRSLLTARGFAVVTTRESDATVDPDRRAEIANHANAQACLSLHAAESGSGVHLFVSSLAPSQGGGLLPLEDRAGCVDHTQPVFCRSGQLGALSRKRASHFGAHGTSWDRQHDLSGGGH